jgi:hypothetical protein
MVLPLLRKRPTPRTPEAGHAPQLRVPDVSSFVWIFVYGSLLSLLGWGLLLRMLLLHR